MTTSSFQITQNIFRTTHESIPVLAVHENDLTTAILQPFLASIKDVVGLAPTYGARRVIYSLAISTKSQVLLVRFSTASKKKHRKARLLDDCPARQLLRDHILCTNIPKCAFQMDRLATALYLDLDLRITTGVDLLSVSITDDRGSTAALKKALGGEGQIHSGNVLATFKHEESADTPPSCSAIQAWAACHSFRFIGDANVLKLHKIDTMSFKKHHLDLLCKTIRDADRLVALKPTTVKNDVSREYKLKDGKVQLQCTRYKTRLVQAQGTQRLEIEFKGVKTKFQARVMGVKGRGADVYMSGRSKTTDNIKSVTTIGREDPTNAEAQLTTLMLRALQGVSTILEHPFVRWIWLGELSSRFNKNTFRPVPLSFSARPLNTSQERAAKTILSNHPVDRVVLCHGPPGTGKTTLIASVVHSIASADRSRPIWLVAQSNVAVKNIAEKLADTGFLKFKILVSEVFHFEWHEHLYQEINKNLIVSKHINDDIVAMNRLILDTRVILCTISFLSRPKIAAITRLVPISTIIHDEASQINISDYLPMLSLYQSTIQKTVFIGDDKQLPPFGQEDIGDLRSIFEIPHLRKKAVFLDTQYRMPTPIGNFVSKHVYGGLLKSHHAITNPESCRFMHVYGGVEEAKGHSWVNHAEVKAVISLCIKYTLQKKAYRVITPYDPQRQLIENGLKDRKIAWEDRCFTVDSFQGNEGDHIIISVVRSNKIGFIREVRRTNVMLTRCKQSMVLCTSPSFAKDVAKSTLVGKLAAEFGNTWLDSRRI